MSTPNHNGPAATKDRIQRLARQVAWIAGVFVAVAVVLLAVDFSHRQAKDPAEVQSYKELKVKLAKDPRDENLKGQIRDADLRLREEFFRQRRFTAVGAWLLLAAAAVFLGAARLAATVKRRLPMPQAQTAMADTTSASAATARWSVAALGILLVAAALALNLRYRLDLSSSATAAPASAPTVAAGQVSAPASAAAPAGAGQPGYPSDEEIRKNWPRFRGPGGAGISAFANAPTQWDGPSGKGILWKTAVPLPGNSSPVVWGDRVFVSGADETKRELYCFDLNSGKLLWQKPAPGTPQSTSKPPEVSEDTGFAAPTPATDGRRVYAMFANGDVAAFDFTGNSVWSRSLGIPTNIYGHASSPVLYRDRLIIQLDQGDAKDKLSKLLALDVQTGKTVWETPREVGNSWPTPIVINHKGKDLLITMAEPWASAYDPANGKEVWRCDCLRQDVGPSPVFAGGTVYTVNQSPQLTAIRPDGQGDITKTNILWTAEDNLPDTASPLATDEYVFLLGSGLLTCYDAKSGEKLWEYEVPDSPNFSASPSLVGSRMYLVDIDGNTYIVEIGKEAKLLGKCELGEACVASPALLDGRIVIRGKENLYCIGQK